MVSPLVTQPIAPPVGERRVVFQGLDWQRYQTIRQAFGDRRAAGTARAVEGDQTRMIDEVDPGVTAGCADVDEDGIPDISIGRICADSTNELATIITKILAYEKDPDAAVAELAGELECVGSVVLFLGSIDQAK